MVDLAVREEDYGTADSLFQRRFPDGAVPISRRAVLALVRRDSALLSGVFAEAARDPGTGALEGARSIAIYFGDTQTADSLARTVAEAASERSLRAGAWDLRAEIALAEGRWADVERALDGSTSYGGDHVALRRALYASLPFLDLPAERVARIRSGLLEAASSRQWTGGRTLVPAELEPAVVRYVVGLLSAQLGDEAAALREAAEIERIAGEDAAGSLAAGLALTIRAEVAWRQGRPGETLALLDRIEPIIPLPLLSSPYLAQEHSRFRRGEALMALGRHEDALRCFASCFSGTPTEMAYLAATHLRRGRILEQLGRAREAAVEYLWVERLWRDAEPPLQSERAHALERLQAITAEPRTPVRQ